MSELDLKKQTLDLRKNKVLDLKKSKGITDQKAAVVLALDFSGSMDSLYRSGKVQELVERILPLGLAFDDNGEVDFYLFHDGFIKMKENITLQNVFGYIQNKVLGKYSMGGTRYAPIINAIVEEFGNVRKVKTGGFMGFGSKESTVSNEPLDYPVYVIFITDGANGDRADAERAIREASKQGIFFQFIGIGYETFDFLQKLDGLSGRFLDNANFFKVDDLARKTDDDLYALLLAEFPGWIPQAKSKGLIK